MSILCVGASIERRPPVALVTHLCCEEKSLGSQGPHVHSGSRCVATAHPHSAIDGMIYSRNKQSLRHSPRLWEVHFELIRQRRVYSQACDKCNFYLKEEACIGPIKVHGTYEFDKSFYPKQPESTYRRVQSAFMHTTHWVIKHSICVLRLQLWCPSAIDRNSQHCHKCIFAAGSSFFDGTV